MSTPALIPDPLHVDVRSGGGIIGNSWLSFPRTAMPSAPDMKFQEARSLSEQYLPSSEETERFVITARR